MTRDELLALGGETIEMEDIFLTDTIGHTTLFVSALAHRSYRSAGGQGLGGSDGYFICTENAEYPDAGFEILAKAVSEDAARMIFDALAAALRDQAAMMEGEDA